MKLNQKIVYILSGILLLSSCTSNFEEINKNPNYPASSDPAYIFNYVIKEGAGEYGGSGDGRIYSTYDYSYVQRWVMQTAAVWGNSTMPPYTLFDQYRIQNLWKYFYSNLLLNCFVLEEMTAENAELVNMHQAARIWTIYNFHLVTDLWGDVPYSDAWKLISETTDEAMHPSYDIQEDIYADMIEILKDAAQSFDDSKVFYTDDMIYDGDMNLWIKFANSLRLRLAMRSGNQAEVAAIVTEDNLISSNDEAALFTYIDATDWWNPYYEMNVGSKNPASPDLTGTSVIKISELMVRQLDDTDDPRLEIYALPTEFDNVTYKGVPNLMNSTLKENQAMGMGVSTSSYIGSYFFTNPTLTRQVLSYAEVCFLRAEAAQRGWTGDDDQLQYNNGVRSALQYYNVEDTLINEFLTNGAPYDGTIEQIITQKWVALFLNGWEAFAEYRRTGFPQLMKWELELDGIKIKKAEWIEVERNYIPGRLPYPQDEEALNPDVYKEVIDRIGSDSYYQQVWWSKQFGTVDYE